MRPTAARIHLSHLQHNLNSIRKQINGRGILAVVKADAYGHGAIETVKTFESVNKPPEQYGVAYADEAAELRKAGLEKPLLVFDLLGEHNIAAVTELHLTATVADYKQIQLLGNYAAHKPRPVHINVDTGMGRVGVHHRDAAELIRAIASTQYVELAGVYTHLSTSDERDKTYARLQLQRFNALIEQMKSEGITCGRVHAANSGAVLDMPEAYYDMVRPGISLYGYYPSSETSESIKLKPVMELVSQVSTVRTFEKDEPVSYGRRYITPGKTKIVSVPLGYADGVNRNLTNKMTALINGKTYPQVGTVTMDRIMFDAGEDVVSVGDPVLLFGAGGKEPTAADWAEALGTIPYEITCAISKRVPRIYVE